MKDDPAADPGPRSSLSQTGLVLSIVAVATCGVFSPVALIVSLAALRQTPRRKAWAGVVLALVAAAEFVGAVWLASRLDTPR